MQKRGLSSRRTASSSSRRLGVRIRQIRQRLGIPQERLADRAGIHVTYLSGLETGRRNPTLNVLVDIANALGMSVSRLLKDVD
jgi:transcriptional regulator with XRE-family HTH domain